MDTFGDLGLPEWNPLGQYGARDDWYISADGRIFRTPEEAIAASLSFEASSGTGAGCSQSPDNLPSHPSGEW